jgi:hypothetical protein
MAEDCCNFDGLSIKSFPLVERKEDWYMASAHVGNLAFCRILALLEETILTGLKK